MTPVVVIAGGEVAGVEPGDMIAVMAGINPRSSSAALALGGG